MKKSTEEKPEKETKIKWFSAKDLNELQTAIAKGRIKVTKHFDLSSLASIRIDRVLAVPAYDSSKKAWSLVYNIDQDTNNAYMREWKKGPGRFLKQDFINLSKGKTTGNSDAYMEIFYVSKEKFIKKALIRKINAVEDESEENRKAREEDYDSNGLLNGEIDGVKYSVIKIVGGNENYSKREIVSKIEDFKELNEKVEEYENQEASQDEIQQEPLF